MCDGQPATDCEIMSLTEFNSKLNDQLAKLDDQFAAINDELKLKKEAFIEMYKKDPRSSHDEAISSLHQQIKDFNPMNPQGIPELETVETTETPMISRKKQIIVCEGFSDDKNDGVDIAVSSCKRSVKYNNPGKPGVSYCFLKHPKIENYQSLQWTLRIPKVHYNCTLGMVINSKLFLNTSCILFLEYSFPKVLGYLSIHHLNIGTLCTSRINFMIKALLFIVFIMEKFVVVLTQTELSNQFNWTPMDIILVVISNSKWIYQPELLLWNWMENELFLILILVTSLYHQSLFWIQKRLK